MPLWTSRGQIPGLPEVGARFLAGRAIKLAGNAVKAVCYLLYLIAPQKRFQIPKRCKPLLQSRSKSDIPRIVWQTHHTRRVTLPVYINFLFNRLLAPTFEFCVFDDPDMDAFVESNYPEEHRAYSRLQIGAARADFWRLLVLQRHGGVYLDIDAHFVWPLELILPARAQELYIEHRDGQLSNYFLASRRGNHHLAMAICALLGNIGCPEVNDVFELTGPAVIERTLRAENVPRVSYRMVCCQGTFTNKFFQYVDSDEGKWTRAQQSKSVVKI